MSPPALSISGSAAKYYMIGSIKDGGSAACGRYTYSYTLGTPFVDSTFVSATGTQSLTSNSVASVAALPDENVLGFTNADLLYGDCTERIEWSSTPDHTTLTYNLGAAASEAFSFANYNLGCGRASTEFLIELRDSTDLNVNMETTYTWLTTSSRTVTINFMDSTIDLGSWTVHAFPKVY